MIHVTIDARDTNELHRELKALLAGDATEPQVQPLQPAQFLKVVQPEEGADFQPAPDPEPVPTPVPDVESVPADDDIVSPAPVPPEPEEPVKGPSMEECRAALNALRAKRGPGAVRTILTNHGVNSFVELDATDYAKVIREAESYEV